MVSTTDFSELDSPQTGSVTTWLFRLNRGDESVIFLLWKRYWQRLVELAKTDLAVFKNRASDDEEDIAQKVFTDIWQRIRSEHQPKPRNRAELWNLMIVITYRKIIDSQRGMRAKKRGGNAPLHPMLTAEVAPDWSVVLNDDLDRLAELKGDMAKKIVELMMAGFDQNEIAERLNSSPRTIQRRLALIREAWKKHIE